MKLFIILIFLYNIFIPHSYANSTRQDWENALSIYISSTMCKSSYSDRSAVALGDLKKYYSLNEKSFKLETKWLDTTFSVTELYDSYKQKRVHVLVFRGSENYKDWKINLKYGKIAYRYKDAESELSADVPQVHRGFYEYTEFVLKQKNNEGMLLTDMLKEDTQADILVTGHSLGGAIATLYATRLLDLGIATERLSVVSFGAPPVGNTPFVQQYQNTLKLLRITSSQDLIPLALQKFVGGYKQFGEHLKFESDIREMDYYDQHNMSLYLNKSLMYFIDNLHQAIAEGVLPPLPMRQQDTEHELVAIYVGATPAVADLPNHEYMKQTIDLQMRHILPSFVFLSSLEADEHYSEEYGRMEELRKTAIQAGAHKVLLLQADASNIPTSKNQAIILKYLIMETEQGAVLGTGAISSTLYSRIGILQTLLQNISQLPLEFLLESKK